MFHINEKSFLERIFRRKYDSQNKFTFETYAIRKRVSKENSIRNHTPILFVQHLWPFSRKIGKILSQSYQNGYRKSKRIFQRSVLNHWAGYHRCRKSDFATLTTDGARFEFIANLECVKKMNFQCDATAKNLAEALKLKQQGNVAFQNKNWIAALTLYNLSLMNTPEENGNSQLLM